MTASDANKGPEPSSEHAVLVVGMHRSGMSVVAEAVGRLGLWLPGGSDPLGHTRDGDRRRFESMALAAESDEALRRLGGSWDAPPPIPGDHAASVGLASMLERSRRAFAAAFGEHDGPVCWTDPRTALLLPFWRQVIDRPVAAILCLRHPLEVARSLEEREAVELPAGLALFERYLRCAVAGLEGLPVFVSDFSDAVGDAGSWGREVNNWLHEVGVVPPGASAHDGSDLPFEDSLRHFRDGDGPVGPRERRLAAAQQELYDELLALRGPHRSFRYELVSAESLWTTYALGQRLDAARMWHGIEWLGQELAGQLLSTPPNEPGRRGDPQPYLLNATEDEYRYRSWLTARGEDTSTRSVAPEDLLASSEPASGYSAALRRLGPRGAEARSVRARSVWARSVLGRPAIGRPAIGRPAAPPVEPPARDRPLFSVVVPCYRTPIDMLDHCVASVLAQSYSSWELCLCDDASGDSALSQRLAFLADSEARISFTTRTDNGGISAATNDALALARGRYVVFLDHDDELAPDALGRIAQSIEERPEADLIYSDEDKIDTAGRRFMPSFKPDWSPDLLTSNAYMCHVLVVRRDLVNELGGLRSEFDGAQDYDLMLRVSEVTSAIVHIPEILYHWRTAPGSASGDTDAKPWAFEAGRRALEDAARRRGITATVVHHPSVPGSYHFMREPRSTHLVSAIIPFRDEPALTAACYRSFVKSPGYDNFEILLVDNDSALPETRALLEDLARDRRVRLVEAPGPFNWVSINNEAARKARGDLLLFLNNDVVARSRGWLAAMVAQAERPEVGAVGARLLYPDGTIQHAGVIVGVGWAATHIQQGLDGDKPGYLSLTTVTRNFSAVTGACLMSRRSVFEEVGGFEEELPIAFNDIDYCLRLRRLGLLVVYTPLAEMTHFESKSRGNSDDVKEAPFFRKRWRSVMLAGDPYYNRNLGRFDNGCRLPVEEDEERWEKFLSMLGESSTS
ncbi:MAG: glycosyltransferase [Actinomycetota bacterium]|nr:glycosyltransferase [Actinomycetota bacterium]